MSAQHTALRPFYLLCLALTLTLGAADCYADESGYQARLRQATLYIDGKLYEQAIRELKSLEFTAEGRQDAKLSHNLALAYYHTYSINQALFYLRQARQLTTDSRLKSQLTETYQHWIKSYGLVHFQSLDQSNQGSIRLEAERTIVNPRRRKTLGVARKQLARGVTTPISFYLPYGSYIANSESFQLKADLPPPTVKLMLSPLQGEGVSTKRSKWVYITLGGVALIATAVGGYYLLKAPSNGDIQMVRPMINSQ